MVPEVVITFAGQGAPQLYGFAGSDGRVHMKDFTSTTRTHWPPRIIMEGVA